MTFNATWSRYMQETMGHIRTQCAFNVTLETLTIKAHIVVKWEFCNT